MSLSNLRKRQSNQLNHVKHAVGLKTLIEKSEASISYLGKINQTSVHYICTILEEDLTDKQENKKVCTRVCYVTLEMLQNICRHAACTTSYASHSLKDGLAKEGVFLAGDSESEYYITTGNKMEMSRVIHLRNTLDRINALDRETLRALRRSVLDTGSINEQGGAGLGFIDIKAKTETEFEYYFDPIDDEYCFFILTIRIKKEPLL